MIDVYNWPTPNGHKVNIMLEEVGLPYRLKPVDIAKGDQFKPSFLKISPNNKIPAIVDRDGPGGKPIAIFESGAILLYLAEKSGKLMPRSVRGRYAVTQWLMFQMASIGPMFGQATHFRVFAPGKNAYALERYSNEAGRLFAVMNERLRRSRYIAGDSYSIADIAIVSWMRFPDRQGQDIAKFPHLKRWRDAVMKRPAVQRGFQVMAAYQNLTPGNARMREVLFGKTQRKRQK